LCCLFFSKDRRTDNINDQKTEEQTTSMTKRQKNRQHNDQKTEEQTTSSRINDVLIDTWGKVRMMGVVRKLILQLTTNNLS
jgi:hypothetical protein